MTRDRVTYVNTPYGPIVAAFLGRTWENMKTWMIRSMCQLSLVDKEGVTLSKLMGDYGVETELFPKISKNEIKAKED